MDAQNLLKLIKSGVEFRDDITYIEYLRLLNPATFNLKQKGLDSEISGLPNRLKRWELMGLDTLAELNEEIKSIGDYLNEFENRKLLELALSIYSEVETTNNNVVDFLQEQKGAINEDEIYEIDDIEIKFSFYNSPGFQKEVTIPSDLNILNSEFESKTEEEKILYISKLLDYLYTDSNFLNMNKKINLLIIEVWFQNQYFEKLIEFKNSIVDNIKDHNLSKHVNVKKMEVGLPRLKERVANDGITSLSRVQTVLLLKMLRKVNIFFKDESIQSKENMYKAIQVLTGYGVPGIKKDTIINKYDETDIVVVQKILKRLTDLKINDL